jgi:hypothetical protein
MHSAQDLECGVAWDIEIYLFNPQRETEQWINLVIYHLDAYTFLLKPWIVLTNHCLAAIPNMHNKIKFLN